MLSERQKATFSSVADLYRRSGVEKDSLENLVKGGFLDTLPNREADRLRLLQEAQRLPAKRKKHERRQPEILLPQPASWWLAREKRAAEHLPLSETRRKRMEWEVLGLNVHRHPLSPYRAALEDLGITRSWEFGSLPHGTHARATGLLECLQCPPPRAATPSGSCS